MANIWKKVNITTDKGEDVEGIAPLIISASRATDIPAFFSEWFINRLEKGYLKWINPFNGKGQYISLQEVRVIVFWTKNASPLIKHLDKIEEKGINYYFQFTLNDYDDEGLEPNVPKLKDRISTFKHLSERIGKDKLIWRFDPLILTNDIDVNILLKKITNIGNQLHPFTNKLVISFADIINYDKVKRNLSNSKVNFIDFNSENMLNLAEGLFKINQGFNFKIATCAEEIDLNKYGIQKNKCIDDNLMIKLFKDDLKLMKFLGYSHVQTSSLFKELSEQEIKRKSLKDKGQRKLCNCIVSKDIGQYNTCNHLCLYCYANYSQNVVERNLRMHHLYNESLI